MQALEGNFLFQHSSHHVENLWRSFSRNQILIWKIVHNKLLFKKYMTDLFEKYRFRFEKGNR